MASCVAARDECFVCVCIYEVAVASTLIDPTKSGCRAWGGGGLGWSVFLDRSARLPPSRHDIYSRAYMAGRLRIHQTHDLQSGIIGSQIWRACSSVPRTRKADETDPVHAAFVALPTNRCRHRYILLCSVLRPEGEIRSWLFFSQKDLACCRGEPRTRRPAVQTKPQLLGDCLPALIRTANDAASNSKSCSLVRKLTRPC